MVNDIFHDMSEGKKGRLYWSINISTETNGKAFNTIACLDSDVHEATKLLIEGNPM